jgi:WbqC-like protein family
MDESLFAKNGLTLEYQHYAPKPYPQRHAGGFVPDLSVIDLLANLGPSSMNFIKSCSVTSGEAKDGHSDPKSAEVSSATTELLEKNAT